MATMGVCIHCEYQFSLRADGAYEDGPCPVCEPFGLLSHAELAEAILTADREAGLARGDAHEMRTASLWRGTPPDHAAELQQSEARYREEYATADQRLTALCAEARIRVQLAGLPEPGLGAGPAVVGLRSLAEST